MIAKYFKARSHDPYFDLALEETLLTYSYPEPILFLWQSAPALIVGSAFNVWSKCFMSGLEEDEVRLSRSVTGGGAVFMTGEALNIVLVANAKYKLSLLSLLQQACVCYGLETHVSGQLLMSEQGVLARVDFAQNDGRILERATVFFNDIYTNLARYITSSHTAQYDYRPLPCTLKVFENELIRRYSALFDSCEKVRPDDYSSLERFSTLLAKHKSWNWCFGDTQAYSISVEGSFPIGEMELHLNLCNGLINACTAYSDAADSGYISSLSQELIGVSPYDADTQQLSGPEAYTGAVKSLLREVALLGSEQ